MTSQEGERVVPAKDENPVNAKEGGSRTSSSSGIQVLRVSDRELGSGDTTGRVWLQLSRGSVAWPMDRTVAQARVSRKLLAAIEEQPPTTDPKKKKK